MSQQFTKAALKDRQRLLKFYGVYTGEIDGLWGPKSEAAERALRQLSQSVLKQTIPLTERSETNIRSLHPAAQKHARLVLQIANLTGHSLGLRAEAISGLRSWYEQEIIYNQGREAPGKIVTNSPPGYSFHNFGLAIDIGLFDIATGAYLKGGTKAEDKHYLAVAASVRNSVSPIIRLGADFPEGRVDLPHYQFNGPHPIAKVRKIYSQGGAWTL